MAKLKNIRLEKKPEEYIGPKVVEIDVRFRERAMKAFARNIDLATNIIIIFEQPHRNYVFTSLSDNDSIAKIERVKHAFLADRVTKVNGPSAG
jgi:hypothetical protein